MGERVDGPYERLCVTCQHCQFSPMSPGYSSLTPGSEMEMHCGLTKLTKAGRRHPSGAYRWDLRDAFSLADARRMLLTAQTCPDYTLYVEPRPTPEAPNAE